jgi:integrase/recombinase XerC/integrase/recombinase XerD
MKLADAVDCFLLEQQLRGNTDKTIQGYKGFLRRFVEFLGNEGVTELRAFTVDNIHQYQLYINNKKNEKGKNDKLAKRSVQTYIRHIKVFAGYLYEQEYIPADMRPKIRIPKAERNTVQILTDKELDLIMSCFNRSEMGLRNAAIVCLMIDCGLRLEEVTRIKYDDINFDKGYMMVTGKGRKGRIVPLGKKMLQSLTDYMSARSADMESVFLTCNRQPITKSTVSQLMKRLKVKTGIKRLHAHLFRHTFATNYLLHGLGDVYELSRLLGHSEIKITEWYLQLASYYMIMERRERVTYLDMLASKNQQAPLE